MTKKNKILNEPVSDFEFGFQFRVCFEFRYSDFEFCFADVILLHSESIVTRLEL